jgi:glycosyltransferase involved in cell wall biosynthesis
MPTANEPTPAGVLLATSFRIPHVGGASTHIETLAAALRGRRMLLGEVTPTGARHRSLRYALLRVLRHDSALVWALERTRESLVHVIGGLSFGDRPVVIHTHDPLATSAAARARSRPVPIVQTVHGPWSRENATMHRRNLPRHQSMMESVEREAFTAADLLVAVDQGQADYVVRDFGVDPRRVIVIPNAVDVDAFPAPAERRDSPFLLVPRRLVPKNGVEFALRAFARVRGGPLRLLIAGDGPLRPDLQRLAAELGVATRVVFLGNVNRAELLAMMGEAVAVLVPSVPVNGIVEATSLAVLEGMASRVPVIGSSIGGVAEIMAGGHGVLVPAADATALAAAIERIVEMTAYERKVLVERARARVRDAYGVDAWMRKLTAVYERALGVRPEVEAGTWQPSRSAPAP